ncbi:MAG: hypothetical protein CFH05_00201, partial [Alphaproteobacteria bacterium MarineAlpha3_Bin4]
SCRVASQKVRNDTALDAVRKIGAGQGRGCEKEPRIVNGLMFHVQATLADIDILSLGKG